MHSCKAPSRVAWLESVNTEAVTRNKMFGMCRKSGRHGERADPADGEGSERGKGQGQGVTGHTRLAYGRDRSSLNRLEEIRSERNEVLWPWRALVGPSLSLKGGPV